MSKYIFNDHAALDGFIAPFSGCVIVCDANTQKLLASPSLAALAARKLPVFTTPVGEEAKSWRVLEQLCDFMLSLNLSRSSLVINLGGGVVSDLGGLAAGLFKRGCEHINIPTTLLAAADAGIGGKTGINTAAGKNLIGMFKEPARVFVFSDLFASLSPEQRACGWAEIIKMALCFDAQFAEQLERSQVDEITALRAASAIKQRVVERDLLERGERALLNYGHTFAHAIEHESDFCIPHGQAVAIGMCMADALARELGLLSEPAERLRKILANYGCASAYKVRDISAFIACMQRDKKNSSSEITTILRTNSGAQIFKNTPTEAISRVLQGHFS